jgi:2-polyprenyl-3-methyl-5-hydroxy-6-metoxy-1,4-benzoquinol methylase
MKKYNKEKDRLGFWQVTPLPTEQELSEFYEKQYYQENTGQYEHTYSEEEIIYFYNRGKVAESVLKRLGKINLAYLGGGVLDIGCGEGFFMEYFYRNNWKVQGADFSSYGIEIHHPHLLSFFTQGNIYNTLNEITLKNEIYDFINLMSVMQCTINPKELLEKIKKIMHDESILSITVSNNFSPFQEHLLNKKIIDNEYWYSPPVHLYYFTLPSLIDFIQSCGYRVIFSFSEFPIELYLANENSNYWMNSKNGKSAHKARLLIDNFLVSENLEKYIDYMAATAQVGLGRNITVFAELVSKKDK